MDARARHLLETSTTIAVLGAHDEPARPAAYVPEYLAAMGYRVLPVNPSLAGRTLFGHRVAATVAELGEPLDLVDVFRRPSALAAHVEDLLSARPRAVWFQLGIRDDAVAKILESHGIEVIQDRCTLADHRRFGLARRQPAPTPASPR
jgi:uncharacterized protein